MTGQKEDGAMPSLTKPKLVITLLPGAKVKVEASVKVGFQKPDLAAIKLLGVKGVLHCELWGSDGNVFNGGDDDLVSLPSRLVTASGEQKFTATLASSALDEDLGGDEIYALFTMKANSSIVSLNAKSQPSNIISGQF
jgi:hypothetical protein